MAFREVLLLIIWVGCAFGDYEIEKHMGLPGPRLTLGLLLNVIGLTTLLTCLGHGIPKVEAARGTIRDTGRGRE